MTEDTSDTSAARSEDRGRLSVLYRAATGWKENGGRERIYAVFVAGLVLASIIAIGSVGVVTATGATASVNAGPPGNVPALGFPPASLDFKGCSEVWVIFRDTSRPLAGGPVDVTIQLSDGSASATITDSDLTTIPGQYGDHPIYTFKSPSGAKILAVQFEGSPLTDNPNQCAENA